MASRPPRQPPSSRANATPSTRLGTAPSSLRIQLSPQELAREYPVRSSAKHPRSTASTTAADRGRVDAYGEDEHDVVEPRVVPSLREFVASLPETSDRQHPHPASANRSVVNSGPHPPPPHAATPKSSRAPARTDAELLVQSLLEQRTRTVASAKVQESLIASPQVTQHELKRALLYLNESGFVAVLEERALFGLCAYPCCSRPTRLGGGSPNHRSVRGGVGPSSPPPKNMAAAAAAPPPPPPPLATKRYRVSLRRRQILVDERDSAGGENTYCSSSCWRRGEWVRRWVLRDDGHRGQGGHRRHDDAGQASRRFPGAAGLSGGEGERGAVRRRHTRMGEEQQQEGEEANTRRGLEEEDVDDEASRIELMEDLERSGMVPPLPPEPGTSINGASSAAATAAMPASATTTPSTPAGAEMLRNRARGRGGAEAAPASRQKRCLDRERDVDMDVSGGDQDGSSRASHAAGAAASSSSSSSSSSPWTRRADMDEAPPQWIEGRLTSAAAAAAAVEGDRGRADGDDVGGEGEDVGQRLGASRIERNGARPGGRHDDERNGKTTPRAPSGRRAAPAAAEELVIMERYGGSETRVIAGGGGGAVGGQVDEDVAMNGGSDDATAAGRGAAFVGGEGSTSRAAGGAQHGSTSGGSDLPARRGGAKVGDEGDKDGEDGEDDDDIERLFALGFEAAQLEKDREEAESAATEERRKQPRQQPAAAHGITGNMRGHQVTASDDEDDDDGAEGEDDVGGAEMARLRLSAD